MSDSGLRRSPFIQSLGYKSVPGGLRRLDEWLEHGEGDGFVLRRIATVYSVDHALIRGALKETGDQKTVEAETASVRAQQIEHAGFRPYIHVEGEFSVPSAITLFAVSGGRFSRIELPREIEDQSGMEQIPVLASLMRQYLIKHGGKCPFFGRAVGFRLVRWEESFRFDLTGALIERVEGRFQFPRATVRVGNKVAEGLFR